MAEVVVNENWPLSDGRAVSPIVLIEIVARPAPPYTAIRKSRGKRAALWLVGIKSAVFHVAEIPSNASTASVGNFIRLMITA